MKRIAFIVFVGVVAIAFSQARHEPATMPAEFPATEEDTTVPSLARISFDSDNFDFGFAPQGNAYLVHYYTVKNMGEDTLHIDRVRPTCGCTAAPMKKSDIAPGESSEIGAIFRLSGYKSATSKSIKVESNDPTHKTMNLRFSANMDTAAWLDTLQGPRLLCEPTIIDLGKGDLFKANAKFMVRNPSDKKLKIKVIDYTGDIISAPKIRVPELKAGKSADIEIAVLKEYDPTSEIKASITLAGLDDSGSEVTRFTVPIIGGGK